MTRGQTGREWLSITYHIRMPETVVIVSNGATSVEMIRQDLACPGCQYNLRGLHGSVVSCPECGTHCDVATLVTERWTESWWKAPGFNILIGPAATFMVGIMLTLVTGMFVAADLVATWIMVIPAVLALIHWGYLWYRVHHNFGEPRSLLLALLAHIIAVGMIISALALLISVLITVVELAYSPDPIRVVAYLAIILFAGVALLICRKGEKFIAGHCIRQHLAKRAKEAAASQSTRETVPATQA